MKIRTCIKCGVEYPATLEYFHSNGNNLLRPDCKKCRNKNRRPDKKRVQRYNKYYNATVKGHLRKIFSTMGQRCNSPKCKAYKNYGGRGIENKFTSSNEFIDYVINELQIDPRNLQIDRIDNDGHYQKGNIRFVTRSENNKNRRRWAKKN